MISVVLYGRNDNYGYNLHKRAAISLNCIAEVLNSEEDEILFVDYNTPNDFPTFPEAIQDTLSKKAKQKIRILRVRPHIHERYRGKTRLVALEPISRNIAIRRSNPANRWILSTNTDMIFVPRTKPSLNEIVRDLTAGFYHAPRLEIPETLWESLDRSRPVDIIQTIRYWGSALHLDEIVFGDPAILYDGPGDFQLMEREVLFALGSFDEEMILGWHVDSNIAKRLYLHYGGIGDLAPALFGYHCDHTRQITPAHTHSRSENDPQRFVYDVTQPDLPNQKSSWGCPDDEIEEVRLREDNAALYVSTLIHAIGEPLGEPARVTYTGDFYNLTQYDSRHVLPFLADLFVCSPKNTRIAWFGVPNQTLRLFAQVWAGLGFTQPVRCENRFLDAHQDKVEAKPSDIKGLVEEADAFVFDFGAPTEREAYSNTTQMPEATHALLAECLSRVIEAERNRIAGSRPLRQIIAINAINNEGERLVLGLVAAGLTPFATRMRHGFSLPPRSNLSLKPGVAGERDEFGRIALRSGCAGIVAEGATPELGWGIHRLVIELSGNIADDVQNLDETIGTVVFRSWSSLVDWAPITWRNLLLRRLELNINISTDLPEPILELTVTAWSPIDFRVVEQATSERVDQNAHSINVDWDRSLELDDWLPFAQVSESGARVRTKSSTLPREIRVHASRFPDTVRSRVRRASRRAGATSAFRRAVPAAILRSSAVEAKEACAGLVMRGPCWRMPTGTYIASVVIVCDQAAKDDCDLGSIYATLDDKVVAERKIRKSEVSLRPLRLSFAVSRDRHEGPLEIKVHSSGKASFTVYSLRVRRRQSA